MNFKSQKTFKINYLKLILTPLLMLFSFALLAQQGMPPAPQQQNIKEDYSENELKEFVNANKVATQVQQESQDKMIEVIEDEGLDINTFNQIMTAQQDPQQDADIPQTDLEKFNSASQKVMTIQQEMQVEVSKAIENTGMDPNTYSEIMLAYQNSPVVQEKVHKILEKEKP